MNANNMYYKNGITLSAGMFISPAEINKMSSHGYGLSTFIMKMKDEGVELTLEDFWHLHEAVNENWERYWASC